MRVCFWVAKQLVRSLGGSRGREKQNCPCSAALGFGPPIRQQLSSGNGHDVGVLTTCHLRLPRKGTSPPSLSPSLPQANTEFSQIKVQAASLLHPAPASVIPCLYSCRHRGTEPLLLLCCCWAPGGGEAGAWAANVGG